MMKPMLKQLMCAALSLAITAGMLLSAPLVKVAADDDPVREENGVIVVDLDEVVTLTQQQTFSVDGADVVLYKPDYKELRLSGTAENPRTFYLKGNPASTYNLRIVPEGQLDVRNPNPFTGTIVLDHVNISRYAVGPVYNLSQDPAMDFGDDSNAVLELIGSNSLITNVVAERAAINLNGGNLTIRPHASAADARPSLAIRSAASNGIGGGSIGFPAASVTISGSCDVSVGGSETSDRKYDILTASLAVSNGAKLTLEERGIGDEYGVPTVSFVDCVVDGAGAGEYGKTYPPAPDPEPEPEPEPAPSQPAPTPYIPTVKLKSEGSGATLELRESQLPSGVTLADVRFVAEQQEASSAPVQAAGATLALHSDLPDGKGTTVYDLDLLLKESGEKVSFTGKVTVTLPIPAGYGSFLRVFHLADDGTMTEVPAVINGSHIVLTLEHFSHYAIVDFASSAGKLPTALIAKAPAATTTSASETAASSESGNAEQNPRTGAAFPALAILLFAAAASVLTTKRKQD